MREPKGFHPTIEPDRGATQDGGAILAMKRDKLKPKVLSYADNLAKQIRDILALYNITSEEELRHLASQRDTPLTEEHFARLQTLIALLQHTKETGEIPTEALLVISVESRTKDIVNPFADIWAENGITGKEKLKKLEIDLGELLESCKETYHRKGLDTWADALPQTAADIILSDPAQRERFEAYLKEGRIPLFMPPASVQLATMKNMVSGGRFSHFKPDITTTDSNGTPSTVEADDGHIPWDDFRDLMAAQNPSLTTGVPDHWYIMWVKPTAKPEATDKTVAEQERYIQQAQDDFKKKYNTKEPLIGGIMPAEYCAFQTLLPAIAKTYLKKMEGEELTEYTPFDYSSYTQFPGIESINGDFAVAQWGNEDEALILDFSANRDEPFGGVRLPVREVV